MKTAANQPPLSILVVEDEAIVRMVTADVLGEAGYNVIEAVNSTEALELIDARPDISLMLTDVRMPGELDGYNLSRLVRMKHAAIGIIVISGDSPPRRAICRKGHVFLRSHCCPPYFSTLYARPSIKNPPRGGTQPTRPWRSGPWCRHRSWQTK